MFKFKPITFVIAALIFMQSCTTVLEPVFLTGENNSLEELQEEFFIKIKTLTFEKAIKANKDYYPRSLMVNGIGSKANVYDEAEFLTTRIPKQLVDSEYRLGLGDSLRFIMQYKYKIDKIKIPKVISSNEYLIGIGDELRFTRIIANNEIQSSASLNNGDLDTEIVVETDGVVASDGSILLLGVGNIKANNRSLDELRVEVRNILIRNGLLPNFQLDITKFKSKKALVISIDNETRTDTINLNIIPISLQELAAKNGVSHHAENKSLIVLERKNKTFRFTATQLFSPQVPRIIIQNEDIITIEMLPPVVDQIAEIGEAGKILLEGVGFIKAENRTLKELQENLKNILADKGLNSEFLLDIVNFQNKKAYFSNNDSGRSVVDLTNKKISLKELLFKMRTSNNKKGIQIVTLTRDKQIYRLTHNKILDQLTPDIWIQGNDQIEVEFIEYKRGQVFTLSGSGQALIIPIDPSKRETLANVLFASGGAFSNLNSKRSEVYLLRGQDPAIAYHLDAQNVSRILVAAQTELRPNDIIYVAERPIVSFTRLLQEITPLRILLRDLKNENIP